MMVKHIASKRKILLVLSDAQITACPSLCNSLVKEAIAEW